MAQMGMQRNADMLDNQWARVQDGEGMQDPIPEYYFTENGEDYLVVGKLSRLRNTYSQTKMHQHCQEGQANPVYVSFL